MDKRPTILIVENAVDVTGSLNSILRSSSYLKSRYHFVFILPSNSRIVELVNRAGFEVCTIPMQEIRKDFLSLISYVPALLLNTIRLARLIRTYRVNLILNNDFYNLIPSVYRFSGGRVRYLCYVRFLPDKFPGILVNLWTRAHTLFSDAIVAVSYAVESHLPASTKTKVIWNELPAESVPLRFSDSQMILYPSNFIRGKGHEHALRSFARISKKHSSWKLRFIGSDMGLEKNRAFKDSLINESNGLGISGSVEFLENDGNLMTHYLQSEFVLNFSESESFSMTCLEALFYGRPVIATRCGGPIEIIDNGETGLLVPVGDLDQMEKSIDRMVSDKAFRRNIGTEAYDRVRKKFSVDNTIEKLAELYQSSLSK